MYYIDLRKLIAWLSGRGRTANRDHSTVTCFRPKSEYANTEIGHMRTYKDDVVVRTIEFSTERALGDR